MCWLQNRFCAIDFVPTMKCSSAKYCKWLPNESPVFLLLLLWEFLWSAVRYYYFSARIEPKNSGILCFLKLFSGSISFLLWWAIVEWSTCVKLHIHSSTLLHNMFLSKVELLCLMNLGYKLVHFLLLLCCIIFSNSSCVNII